MEKNCATKSAEWESIVKTRSQELLAIADTIKILNDDDALELFKKTLPGAASLVQIQVTSKQVIDKAVASLRESRKHKIDYRVDLIEMALHGKAVDFGKVIGMIDNMVALLTKEQADDDAKIEQCEKDFDLAEDKKKELDREIMLLEKAIGE